MLFNIEYPESDTPAWPFSPRPSKIHTITRRHPRIIQITWAHMDRRLDMRVQQMTRRNKPKLRSPGTMITLLFEMYKPIFWTRPNIPLAAESYESCTVCERLYLHYCSALVTLSPSDRLPSVIRAQDRPKAAYRAKLVADCTPVSIPGFQGFVQCSACRRLGRPCFWVTPQRIRGKKEQTSSSAFRSGAFLLYMSLQVLLLHLVISSLRTLISMSKWQL